MQSKATDVINYIQELPEDRRLAVEKLRKVILTNLPAGLKEEMNYGMIGYIVRHSIYPLGYHCDPSKPLPFLNIASQKNFIGFYHMGIYANTKLKNWFISEFTKLNLGKLDMGKSCIRFKNLNKIPYDLLGQLITKMTVQEWISIYEKAVRRP